MGVSFEVGPRFFEIGSSGFLHSFFSTVSHHCEKQGWGSRFPALMKELYFGNLLAPRVIEAQRELAIVAVELSKLKPTEVVWDIDDLGLRPPWGDDISPHIGSLADYFVTSDGRDLIEVMRTAFEFARVKGWDVGVASV